MAWGHKVAVRTILSKESKMMDKGMEEIGEKLNGAEGQERVCDPLHMLHVVVDVSVCAPTLRVPLDVLSALPMPSA